MKIQTMNDQMPIPQAESLSQPPLNSDSPSRKAKMYLQNLIKDSFFANSSDHHNEENVKNSFKFTKYFIAEPKPESLEESKLGIHYTIKFHDIYKEGRKLGEGCVGLVKKAKRLSDGKLFAVKIVKTCDAETIYNIKKEFINIVKLDHCNIVKVFELYIDESKGRIYSIMELINSSEMFEVIKSYGSYSEEIASKIFKQILSAIQYMHSKGCCHRDLKPNNILCNEDGSEVKITDFNVSKFDENHKKRGQYGFSLEKIKMWTYTGTIAFSAPEILEESEYNQSVDMWSAGVVLYTMLCGYQPFTAEYVKDLVEQIIANKYEFHAIAWDIISFEAKDLIKRCLTKNPNERITPTNALMHPWIAHTKADPNILSPFVFENLRKNINRLSNRRIFTSFTKKSKSGDGDELYQEFEGSSDEYNEENNEEYQEKMDQIIENRDRRAISFGEDLIDSNFFHFRAKKGTINMKNSRICEENVENIEKIKEEEKK